MIFVKSILGTAFRFVTLTVPLFVVVTPVILAASVESVAPEFTVKLSNDVKLPVYVTVFAIIPFTVNPAAKPLKFAAGVASRFVSWIVPVPVAVFPLRFTASVVRVTPLFTLTLEFWKFPVNVEFPVNWIVSLPLNVRFAKSCDEDVSTWTTILPAPLVAKLPKILSVTVIVPELIDKASTFVRFPVYVALELAQFAVTFNPVSNPTNELSVLACKFEIVIFPAPDILSPLNFVASALNVAPLFTATVPLPLIVPVLTVIVPLDTIKFELPKFPVNVASPDQFAFVVPPVIFVKSILGTAFRFVTLIVELFVIAVALFKILASTLIVPLETVNLSTFVRFPRYICVPVPDQSTFNVVLAFTVAKFAFKLSSKFVTLTVPVPLTVFPVNLLASALIVEPEFTVNVAVPKVALLSTVNVEFPVTVVAAFPKFPVNVTFPSLIAVTVVLVILDKFAVGVTSRFVTATVPVPVIVSVVAFEASRVIVPGVVTEIFPVPLIVAVLSIIIFPPLTRRFAFPIFPVNVAVVAVQLRFVVPVPVIPDTSTSNFVWNEVTFTVPLFVTALACASFASIFNVAPKETPKVPLSSVAPERIFIVPLETVNAAVPIFPVKSVPVPLQFKVVVAVVIVE